MFLSKKSYSYSFDIAEGLYRAAFGLCWLEVRFTGDFSEKWGVISGGIFKKTSKPHGGAIKLSFGEPFFVNIKVPT